MSRKLSLGHFERTKKKEERRKKNEERKLGIPEFDIVNYLKKKRSLKKERGFQCANLQSDPDKNRVFLKRHVSFRIGTAINC